MGFMYSSALLEATDLTIYGGFQKSGTLTRTVIFDSAAKLVQANNLGGTLGVRIGSSKPIGFEQGFSFSSNFIESGLKAFNVHSNLIVQFPGHISPYATAGVGFMTNWGGSPPNPLSLAHLPSVPTPNDVIHWADLESSAFKFGTRFAFNYGGGVKLRKVAGPLGLRIDMRGYSVLGVFDQTLNFFEATIGLTASW
jgi:hypothetical protein